MGASHPTFKTGLLPTDPAKPILEIDKALTGVTPVVPPAEDRFKGVTFGLDGNDQYGDCGPTSVDNHRRSTSKVATGTQRTAPLEAVYQLYRESGNPNFPQEDNGVEMGQMLDALMKNGLAGDKPVAFGRSRDMSDAGIERLVAIFGGVLFAVDLMEAQQGQTEASPPKWDYKPTPQWGGHAIYCGKYEVVAPGSVDAEVISWAKDVQTTDTFRFHQLEEVWVIVWPWHLEHPAFLEGVDVTKLAEAFKELTGKTLPVPAPPPAPAPTPTPAPTPIPPDPAPTPVPSPHDAADVQLWAEVGEWAHEHHVRGNHKAASAVVRWAKAKGLV